MFVTDPGHMTHMVDVLPIGRAQGIVVRGRVSAAAVWAIELTATRVLREEGGDVCVDLCEAEPKQSLCPVLERLDRLATRTGGWLTVVCPPGRLRESLGHTTYIVLSGRDVAATTL